MITNFKTVSELINIKKKSMAKDLYNDVLKGKPIKIENPENIFSETEVVEMELASEKMFFAIFSEYKLSFKRVGNLEVDKVIFGLYYRRFENKNLFKSSENIREIVKKNPTLLFYTYFGDASFLYKLFEEISFEEDENDLRYLIINEKRYYALKALKIFKAENILSHILNDVNLYFVRMFV